MAHQSSLRRPLAIVDARPALHAGHFSRGSGSGSGSGGGGGVGGVGARGVVVVFRRRRDEALEHGERQRDDDGHEPNGGHDERGDARCHARHERPHDREVAVDGDSERRQRAHVHRDAHRHWQRRAEQRPEDPAVQKQTSGRQRHIHAHH